MTKREATNLISFKRYFHAMCVQCNEPVGKIKEEKGQDLAPLQPDDFLSTILGSGSFRWPY